MAHIPCVIVDIDGTIADITHRVHHINGLVKDWDSFNAVMNQDIPKLEVIKVVRALAESGIPIIIVTGRFEHYREETVAWLLEHKVPFTWLLMRNIGDFRSDHIIKCEIYKSQISPSFKVMTVFDDRDSVVEMWRKEGLVCMQVQKGDY